MQPGLFKRRGCCQYKTHRLKMYV